MEYDALNRVTKLTYPTDINSSRKELIFYYNIAGTLGSVNFDGNDYIDHIGYNAIGQRLLIAFGNEVMKRYVYDSKTFRLERLKSERYTYTLCNLDALFQTLAILTP